jgi:hypothetical protein
VGAAANATATAETLPAHAARMLRAQELQLILLHAVQQDADAAEAAAEPAVLQDADAEGSESFLIFS